MDDPWSTNAWSTEDDNEVPFHINRPEWEISEHDAEFNPESGNTLDSNLPSSSTWAIPSGSAWDVGNDVWTTNNNVSYNEQWNSKESTSLSTQTIPETPSDKPADLETVRPALPTPPSSPLAIPSRVVAPEILEMDAQTLDVPEPSEMLTTLATPDHFGSFESAQDAKPFASSDNESWAKEPTFQTENSFVEEPWKSTWDEPVDEDAIESQPKDEWEIAQDTQRKLNEKIPQELLRLIISRWEAIAEEHYSQYDLPGELDYSWRKGLDNVPGLSERVDNFIPSSSYFSLPTPFPKSEIAKTVKESLRLSRFYALSQSSPMAQFYASKGSLEWENSVKMQKLAANDEWGWDLKQGQEEMSEPQEAASKEPEKRGSGFLSFWKRRTASESTTATSNTQSEPVPPEKKEQTPVGPAPTSSLRPSLENPPSTPLPSKTPLESTTELTTPDYDQQPQPSVVSRLFNRLSRRPTSGIIVETTEHSPSPSTVSLSADDLAFLSDIVPSDPKPKSSLSIQKASGSVNSLEEVLSFSAVNKKDQLPAPLAPPPASSSSRISPAAESLKKVKKGYDAIDLLGDDLIMSSPSSVDRMPHLDRANLLFEDISVFENKPSTPEQKPSRTPLDRSLISSSSRVDASTPPNLQQPPAPALHLQPRASSSSSSPRSSASIIPPPPSKVGHSKPSVSHHSVVSSVPQSLDDFSDFVSSNHIKSTTTPLSNPVFDHNDIDDFGDFGDFVSTPQFSQHNSPKSTLHSNSTPQVDFRGSSSVTIPILKPPPKFTTVGSDFIGRNTDQSRVRSPPLSSGKSSPLPQVPLQTQLPPQPQVIPLQTQLRPPQTISQQQTASVPSPSPSPSPSIGKTASTASSVNKKSGLSAQDLSFFEGL